MTRDQRRPRPQGPTLTLAAFLPYRLSIVSEIVSRLFSRHYDVQFDLSIPEWRVMAVLGERAPLSTQGVIERTQMDRVRVSRAVIRLADKGLIERTAHPQDRRAQLLRLSAKGSATYQDIVPLAFGLQARLMQTLTAGEASQLDQLLLKLAAAAGALEQELD